MAERSFGRKVRLAEGRLAESSFGRKFVWQKVRLAERSFGRKGRLAEKFVWQKSSFRRKVWQKSLAEKFGRKVWQKVWQKIRLPKHSIPVIPAQCHIGSAMEFILGFPVLDLFRCGNEVLGFKSGNGLHIRISGARTS